MTAQPSIQFACADDVATITLNRPQKRNALNEAMWLGLAEAVRHADALPGAKIIVIRGAGGHFAAGADISEFDTVYASRERSAQYRGAVEDGARAITDAAKPAIAMIEGYCIGGGVGVALACDLRIAAEGARFGVPAARLGLSYRWSGIKKLVDLVGPAYAKEIFYTARQFSAAEAERMGLVNKVFDQANFMGAVMDYAKTLAETTSPRSMAVMKAQVWKALFQDFNEALAVGDAEMQKSFSSADFKEGVAHFVEKRAANFTGK